MPNPEDPNEAECRTCHDTGFIPGTYRLCSCQGMGEKQVTVHKFDGKPCELSLLDHGDPVCIHGYLTIEVWVPDEG